MEGRHYAGIAAFLAAALVYAARPTAEAFWLAVILAMAGCVAAA